MIKSLI